MFGRVERRGFEVLKAVASVAVLAGGTLLSEAVGPTIESAAADAADIIGVWRWVADVPSRESVEVQPPMLEIRRDLNGALELRVLAGGMEHRHGEVDGTTITFHEGHLCVVAGDGTSFKGTISEDGTQIEGVVHRKGARAPAYLERVLRAQPQTSSRRTYAT